MKSYDEIYDSVIIALESFKQNNEITPDNEKLTDENVRIVSKFLQKTRFSHDEEKYDAFFNFRNTLKELDQEIILADGDKSSNELETKLYYTLKEITGPHFYYILFRSVLSDYINATKQYSFGGWGAGATQIREELDSLKTLNTASIRKTILNGLHEHLSVPENSLRALLSLGSSSTSLKPVLEKLLAELPDDFFETTLKDNRGNLDKVLKLYNELATTILGAESEATSSIHQTRDLWELKNTIYSILKNESISLSTQKRDELLNLADGIPSKRYMEICTPIQMHPYRLREERKEKEEDEEEINVIPFSSSSHSSYGTLSKELEESKQREEDLKEQLTRALKAIEASEPDIKEREETIALLKEENAKLKEEKAKLEEELKKTTQDALEATTAHIETKSQLGSAQNSEAKVRELTEQLEGMKLQLSEITGGKGGVLSAPPGFSIPANSVLLFSNAALSQPNSSSKSSSLSSAPASQSPTRGRGAAGRGRG